MRKASLTCVTATVFGRTAKDEENDKLAIKFMGSNNVTRRLLCVVAVLVAFAVSGFAPAEAQTRTWTKQERDAVQVVNGWDAAWATKDAEKIGAFMAENCEFRADPSEPELKKGRAQFVSDIKRLVELGITIQIVDTVAYGGEAGTAILQKRVDTITINGKKREIPLAAFFRVKDGKIQEWLDIPLVILGPPPGAQPKQ
jgi:limonene-1,2-epoxide hydrolase